jgi:hypothetical protein
MSARGPHGLPATPMPADGGRAANGFADTEAMAQQKSEF